VLSKTQQVWRHITSGAIESSRRRWPSVTALADELGMGVSTVHRALSIPVEIGAVAIRPAGGLRILDPGRILLLWAGRRDLRRDLVERFVVEGSAPAVERRIGNPAAILGGFGAVVARTGGNTIADYQTVLVYGDPDLIPPQPDQDQDPERTTEVLVLEPDPLLPRYGRVTPLVQAWVDLFNLPNWQADRFVYHLLPQLLADVLPEPRLLSA